MSATRVVDTKECFIIMAIKDRLLTEKVIPGIYTRIEPAAMSHLVSDFTNIRSLACDNFVPSCEWEENAERPLRTAARPTTPYPTFSATARATPSARSA